MNTNLLLNPQLWDALSIELMAILASVLLGWKAYSSLNTKFSNLSTKVDTLATNLAVLKERVSNIRLNNVRLGAPESTEK